MLRNIATHCSFGDNLNEALRDHFVCGIHSEAIQKRLLTVSDLMFAKAVEIAEGMETAAITCQEVECKVPTTGLIQQVTDSALKRKWAVKDNYYRRCYRCGRENHIAPDCKFKNAICNDCGKRGHIAGVCNSKTVIPSKPLEKLHSNTKKEFIQWKLMNLLKINYHYFK